MPLFEELDWQPTPLGALTLRRRRLIGLGRDVVEVKLGEEHLMSDLFTAGEIALAEIGLAAAAGDELDVAVGGLGLGYTAQAALADPRVASVLVIEALAPVIDWHRRGLVPIGDVLATSPRCELVEADFFALAAAGRLDPARPQRRFDAVLLDVDHSPSRVLHAGNAALYGREGLARLRGGLAEGGVFALWSDDPAEPGFLADLEAVFGQARAEAVGFDNPLDGGRAENTVYVARRT